MDNDAERMCGALQWIGAIAVGRIAGIAVAVAAGKTLDEALSICPASPDNMTRELREILREIATAPPQ